MGIFLGDLVPKRYVACGGAEAFETDVLFYAYGEAVQGSYGVFMLGVVGV